MLLEIDGTIIIAGASFILFMIVMNYIFYQPVLKIMAERNALVELEERSAQTATKNKEELSQKKESDIKSTKQKAHEILLEKTTASKKQKEEKVKNALEVSKAELESARIELNEEKARLEDDIVPHIEDISSSILSKLVSGNSQNGGSNA